MSYLELDGSRHAIPAGESVIGSDASSLLALEGPGIAPRHLVVVATSDGQASVRRAADDAETHINGVLLGPQPAPLLHGDKIEVGGREFSFVDERRSGSTTFVSVEDIARLQAVGAKPAAKRKATAGTGGRLVSLTDGREYAIEGGSLVIGREATCEVVVPHKRVSRRHAEITATPKGYVIIDMSSNGTFVNGERISGQRLLARADVIRLGDDEFRFYADKAVEPEAPAPSPPSPPTPPSAPPEPPPRAAPGAEYRLGDTLHGIPSTPLPSGVPAAPPPPAPPPVAPAAAVPPAAPGPPAAAPVPPAPEPVTPAPASPPARAAAAAPAAPAPPAAAPPVPPAPEPVAPAAAPAAAVAPAAPGPPAAAPPAPPAPPAPEPVAPVPVPPAPPAAAPSVPPPAAPTAPPIPTASPDQVPAPTAAAQPPVPPRPSVGAESSAGNLANLIVRNGALKGQRFSIRVPVVNIGRADYNDIVIADLSVSSSHAKIQLREGIWILVDLGSTNGSFVDGERVEDEAPLAPGALIRFGDLSVVFEPTKDDSAQMGGGTQVMGFIKIPPQGEA